MSYLKVRPKRPSGMGAVAIDPNAPWWQNLLNTVSNVAQDVTTRPVQSVDALTAQVAQTRQTMILVALGIGAVMLLNRRR